MKITIRFKHNDSASYPCAALVNISETYALCAVGKTWDEVEREVIQKAKAALIEGEPPAEKEIEL